MGFKHYSQRITEADLHRVKFFLRWRGRNSQVRLPCHMSKASARLTAHLSSQHTYSKKCHQPS